MLSLADTFTLRNGVKIPCLGFGTWQATEEIGVTAAQEAIKVGYRLFDSAAAYGTEANVGKAIRASGLERKDFFVTSKVWNDDRGYETTLAAFERTLENFGLDYLDLYLIHWPASARRFENWEEINLETWRAMTELYKAGKIRAIGVSNFLPHHLKALMSTEVPPMVDQIEYHPGQTQAETVEYCKANHIIVEAWSPLGTGEMLKNPQLNQLAASYGRSAAQLCLRWCLQNGVLPIAKSVTPARIRENTQIFDFSLSEADMALINAMPYFGGSPYHPDKNEF